MSRNPVYELLILQYERLSPQFFVNFVLLKLDNLKFLSLNAADSRLTDMHIQIEHFFINQIYSRCRLNEKL